MPVIIVNCVQNTALTVGIQLYQNIALGDLYDSVHYPFPRKCPLHVLYKKSYTNKHLKIPLFAKLKLFSVEPHVPCVSEIHTKYFFCQKTLCTKSHLNKLFRFWSNISKIHFNFVKFNSKLLETPW